MLKVLDDGGGGSPRAEYLVDALFLEARHVLVGDDAASEDEDVLEALPAQEPDDLREKRHVGAGQKGEPGSFSPEQILTAAEWSIARGKEIRQKIKEATGA